MAGASGTKVAEVRYRAWGEDRYAYGTTPTTYRYTGQRWEAGIGLYFYNARWYDPALGRFVQPDTVGPEPGNPQALNRYAYVYNNPLHYTDPSGHWVETLWDIANIGWDIYEVYQDPGNACLFRLGPIFEQGLHKPAHPGRPGRGDLLSVC